MEARREVVIASAARTAIGKFGSTLANGISLCWDWDKVNVYGGAIAPGHPIGCSGTRILVTLLHALLDRCLRTGLVTPCLGGGEAVALSVEMN